jgi:hypothetical protein
MIAAIKLFFSIILFITFLFISRTFRNTVIVIVCLVICCFSLGLDGYLMRILNNIPS